MFVLLVESFDDLTQNIASKIYLNTNVASFVQNLSCSFFMESEGSG